MQLSVKSLDEVTQLPLYKAKWEALRKQQQLGFCCSFDWLYTWAQYYLSRQDKIAVQLYFDQQQLVAIVPLYLRHSAMGYELFLLGQGEAEEEEVASEFQDFIIKPSYQDEVFKKLHNALEKIEKLLAVEFRDILPDSACGQFFERYLVATQPLTSAVKRYRYVVPINDHLNVIRGVSTRRKMSKSLTAYGLKLNLPNSFNDVATMYQKLIALHQQSWRSKAKAGAFSRQRFVDFHWRFIADTWQQGRLLIFSISQDEDIVAVFYGVIDGDTLSYYQSGLDADRVNNIGYVMHAQALKLGQLKGLVNYDLMAASETSYKRRIIAPSQVVISPRMVLAGASWLWRIASLKKKLASKFKGALA